MGIIDKRNLKLLKNFLSYFDSAVELFSMCCIQKLILEKPLFRTFFAAFLSNYCITELFNIVCPRSLEKFYIANYYKE